MVPINLEKRTCEKQCVLPKTYAREGAEREVGKEEPVSVSSVCPQLCPEEGSKYISTRGIIF